MNFTQSIPPINNLKINPIMNLKKTILPGVAGLALFAAPFANAFTYSDGDVLLIFRSDGLHNVEFDLGNISQFLGHPDGYTNVVANWDSNVVTSNYSLIGGGAQFAVLATTSSSDPNRTAWVSDSQPLTAVNDLAPSQWITGIYTPINATGVGAQNDPNAPSGANYDDVASAAPSAFDYIAANRGQTPGAIPYLGGSSGIGFKVTGVTPTTVLFYAIHPSSSPIKPPSTLIGSFSLSADGILVFRSGPLLDTTQITSVSSGGGTVPVTFNTQPAVKYRLRYSTDLSESVANWTILPPTAAGDGSPRTLFDTSATNAARFYVVESYP